MKKDMKKILIIACSICLICFGIYSQIIQHSDNLTLQKKKELIKKEIINQGYSYNDVIIISEKRSKFLNSLLINSAPNSTHLRGLAVDYWVMDLNQDGKWNSEDVYLLKNIILKVENNNEDVIGGLGLYFKSGMLSSRMVHTDVRGYAKEWYH